MAKEVVKHHQAPDPRRQRQPVAARRSRPRSGRRQHHGVLQGVQRRHPEPGGRRAAGGDHRLQGQVASPSSPRSRRPATCSRRPPGSPPAPGEPNKKKVGKITKAQLMEVVKIKMPDLNTKRPGSRRPHPRRHRPPDGPRNRRHVTNFRGPPRRGHRQTAGGSRNARGPPALQPQTTWPNNRSKRYQKAAALVEAGKTYALEEAVGTVKKFPAPKFDPTVTAFLPPRRGSRARATRWSAASVSLPHGTGKNVRVAVFAQGEAAEAAKAAGAEHVGFEDLIKKVQEGFTDFDVGDRHSGRDDRSPQDRPGPRPPRPDAQPEDRHRDRRHRQGGARKSRPAAIDYKLDKNGNISGADRQGLLRRRASLRRMPAPSSTAWSRAKPASRQGQLHPAASPSPPSMCPGVPLEAAAYTKAT